MTESMPRRRRLFERKEVTRHGKVVWYFRRPGQPRVRLPDEYGSAAYLEAYERALAGKTVELHGKAPSGSLSWLVSRYKASGHFASLAPSSRMARDYIMQAVCRSSGHLPFDKIRPKHIQEAMDRRAKTPHAANNFLVAMSVLFKWAVVNEHVKTNPCDGIESRKDRIEGHHAWTIEEVEQFRQKHPVGTKPRLALDLLLFTGLRRSDVIVIGRQHVRAGVITLRTGKTKATVHLPIFPELQRSIDQTPTGELAFLTSKKGVPFESSQSFGNWFVRQCKAAGLPAGCSAHGLRKTGATIAANNGASAHELMAMYGWSRLSMAEVYTKEADKARLARSASERIANNAKPHLDQDEVSSAENAAKITG